MEHYIGLTRITWLLYTNRKLSGILLQTGYRLPIKIQKERQAEILSATHTVSKIYII